MNVFFRNTAGQLANDYWTSGGGWVNQTLAGTANLTGDPSVLANTANWMNVFARTTGQSDRQLLLDEYRRLGAAEPARSGQRRELTRGLGQFSELDERLLREYGGSAGE